MSVERSEPQFEPDENPDNLKDEEEAFDRKLKEEKTNIGKKFDHFDGSKKAVEEILSFPDWRFKFGVFDDEEKAKSVEEELLKCADIVEREEFTEKVVELMVSTLKFRLESPEEFEQTARDSREKISDQKRLSENLFYNYSDDGKTVRIHLADSSTLGIVKTKKSIKEGLKNLAELLRENEKIEYIKATSPIFGKNPKLGKFLGFSEIRQLGDEERGKRGPGTEGPVGEGVMSRDEFLEKWLEK